MCSTPVAAEIQLTMLQSEAVIKQSVTVPQSFMSTPETAIFLPNGIATRPTTDTSRHLGHLIEGG